MHFIGPAEQRDSLKVTHSEEGGLTAAGTLRKA